MNARLDDVAPRLAELARALDALGVDVRASDDGALICHSPRTHELRGRNMMLVDADDDAIAIGMPWARVRYRVPSVAALCAVAGEWFLVRSGTPVGIDDEIVARHGLEALCHLT